MHSPRLINGYSRGLLAQKVWELKIQQSVSQLMHRRTSTLRTTPFFWCWGLFFLDARLLRRTIALIVKFIFVTIVTLSNSENQCERTCKKLWLNFRFSDFEFCQCSRIGTPKSPHYSQSLISIPPTHYRYCTTFFKHPTTVSAERLLRGCIIVRDEKVVLGDVLPKNINLIRY